MKRLVGALMVFLLLACAAIRSREPAPSMASSPTEPAPPEALSAPDAAARPASTQESSKAEAPAEAEIVRDDCLACHSEDLLRQQRLTSRQWAKTIEKMRGWGAPTSAESVERLAAYLESTYSSRSGPFEAEHLPATESGALFTRLPDGPLSGGSAARGLELYRDRCLACHAEDGRGGPEGVGLAGRGVLNRAPDFVKTLRDGRGRMPGFADTTDPEAADLLAYLRSLPFP